MVSKSFYFWTQIPVYCNTTNTLILNFCRLLNIYYLLVSTASRLVLVLLERNRQPKKEPEKLFQRFFLVNVGLKLNKIIYRHNAVQKTQICFHLMFIIPLNLFFHTSGFMGYIIPHLLGSAFRGVLDPFKTISVTLAPNMLGFNMRRGNYGATNPSTHTP